MHTACSPVATGRPYIYSISAGFAEIVKVERQTGRVLAIVYHKPFSYGVYGTTSSRDDVEETVRRALRKTVENALTDYLKANFDL